MRDYNGDVSGHIDRHSSSKSFVIPQRMEEEQPQPPGGSKWPLIVGEPAGVFSPQAHGTQQGRGLVVRYSGSRDTLDLVRARPSSTPPRQSRVSSLPVADHAHVTCVCSACGDAHDVDLTASSAGPVPAASPPDDSIRADALPALEWDRLSEQEYFSILQRHLQRQHRITAPRSSTRATLVEELDDSSELEEDHSMNNGYFNKFFTEERLIGRGGFASVFLVQHVLEGVSLGQFAVKKVAIGELKSNPWLFQVMREVSTMQQLRSHRNVVNYFHSWIECVRTADVGPTIPHLFILMEYANGGTLADLIFGRDDLSPVSRRKAEHARRAKLRRSGDSNASGDRGSLKEPLPGASPAEKLAWRASGFSERPRLSCDEVLAFFVDICNALAFIHGLGFVHRDIKPHNVLVHIEPGGGSSSPNLVRLLVSDLGTTIPRSEIRGGAKRSGASGTVGFMAPELIDRDDFGNLRTDYDSRVDMWSLGVLLHCMMFRGLMPFSSANDPAANPDEVMREVLEFESPFDDALFDGRDEGTLDQAQAGRDVRPPAHDSVRVAECVCTRDLMRLLGRLLQPDPSLRPSSGEILRLPFVQDALGRRNADFVSFQCVSADDDVLPAEMGLRSSSAATADERQSSVHLPPRVTSVDDFASLSGGKVNSSSSVAGKSDANQSPGNAAASRADTLITMQVLLGIGVNLAVAVACQLPVSVAGGLRTCSCSFCDVAVFLDFSGPVFNISLPTLATCAASGLFWRASPLMSKGVLSGVLCYLVVMAIAFGFQASERTTQDCQFSLALRTALPQLCGAIFGWALLSHASAQAALKR